MSSGSFIARREISVFTADGTSRSAFPASVQTPSISWTSPPSRYANAISSTMNGTPSACACITAAPDASTGPPSTCARNSRVSVCENRSSFRRRTTPTRPMSATRFTASVTTANSSGRIANIRKIGLAPSVRTT